MPSSRHHPPGVVPSVPRSPWLPLLLTFLGFSLPTLAQDSPTLTVDEQCAAPAYAPDGRLAYAVRRILTSRRLEIQRDDLWLVGADGKRRRIVNGEKLVQGPRGAGLAPFSYSIQSIRWSPDGTRLTVEMLTSEMVDQRGNTKEGVVTLLLDENGKEIKIAGADSVIPEGTNAAWLADGATVVYLQEAVKPKLLFSVNSVRPLGGRGGPIFTGHVFAAAAWNAKQDAGVAVERDRSLRTPPHLVSLDLPKEMRHELATLEGYAGGLSLSPSGKRVAYFRDAQVLEIRDMEQPDRVARLRVAYGSYQWAADERRILMKRGLDHRSGDLAWVALPPLAPGASPASAGQPSITEGELRPILHGLSFRDFALSPDGRWLAVIQPGKRGLLVYAVE
jgi:dipeptidyl aminopeptidase/acylaminoacyl peptidase